MTSLRAERPKIAAAKLTLLFFVFFLIALGLGYPILNRFDPRQVPGLSDVKTYAAMVSGTARFDAGHVRFRVLVPWIAKPFCRLAQGRIGTWDSIMFSLLVVDSLFVAGTGVLIVVLGTRQLSNYPAALAGSLIYLLNFAVPNLRLVGLVDAGEGFFLLALLTSLAELKLWPLPLIAVLGALTKESFIPFNIVFTAVWWFATRHDRNLQQHRWTKNAAWILSSWVLSWAALAGLQRVIAGTFSTPWQFAFLLHHGHDYLAHFASSLYDRNLWYIFSWLLPTATPNLKRFPASWLTAIGATCGMAFLLDGYYGAEPGTIGRALFTIAGPVLSISSALLLTRSS